MQQILAVLMLVIILSGCDGQSSQISNEEEQETKVRAVALIQALEAYHQDHGTYPADLPLLIPDYLPAMIQTAKGTDFRYELIEKGENYRLFIDEVPCIYRSYASAPPGYEYQWECL